MTSMSKSLNEHMYLVVRSLKHQNNKIDYAIQRGDIIKLGRIKFAVKEINIVEEVMEVDEGNQVKVQKIQNFEAVNDEEFFEFKEVESIYNNKLESENESSHNPKATPTTTTEGGTEEIPICRICWFATTEADNPLLNSCQCSGSVRFIHLKCLMNWLS